MAPDADLYAFLLAALNAAQVVILAYLAILADRAKTEAKSVARELKRERDRRSDYD